MERNFEAGRAAAQEEKFQKILAGDPEHPVQLAIAKIDDPEEIKGFSEYVEGKLGVTRDDIEKAISTMSRVPGMEARAARWRDTLAT